MKQQRGGDRGRGVKRTADSSPGCDEADPDAAKAAGFGAF